jgi:hypothetical protein
MQADAVLPAYPYPRTVEERTIIKDHKKLKTWNEGRPIETPEELLNGLLSYVDDLQEIGNAVSTTIVTLEELLRRSPQLLQVGFVLLCHCVLCFLKRHHCTFCAVTQKAQNHHYHAMVIDGWVGYINQQIVASAYMAKQICNFDETNIDCEPAPHSMLSKISERTVSLQVNGHSGRCTIMLGCMASRVKLPAFIIWKAVQDGRIHRNCQQNVFPGDNIYTVQPSGWMDGEAFQEWVQHIVRPFVEVHKNSLYLLLDQFLVHMQHNNTFALQQISIEVDFIPAGYTPILQVLDKGVHKPFKQYLREESIAFMVNNPEGAKPTQLDIAHWIRWSWDQVHHTAILKTWHSIGIHPLYNK